MTPRPNHYGLATGTVLLTAGLVLVGFGLTLWIGSMQLRLIALGAWLFVFGHPLALTISAMGERSR